MKELSWPTALFLSVFTSAIAFLIYEKMVPSDAIIGMGSAVVGYLVGKWPPAPIMSASSLTAATVATATEPEKKTE